MCMGIELSRDLRDGDGKVARIPVCMVNYTLRPLE